MPIPWGSILTGTIPVLGSLGAAAIQRKQALADWQRMANYNHPGAQAQRLKAAGIPLSAMFNGSGATQQAPDVKSTNVDPTLGSAKGMDNYFTNRMQQKQLELLEKQIKNKENEIV